MCKPVDRIVSYVTQLRSPWRGGGGDPPPSPGVIAGLGDGQTSLARRRRPAPSPPLPRLPRPRGRSNAHAWRHNARVRALPRLPLPRGRSKAPAPAPSQPSSGALGVILPVDLSTCACIRARSFPRRQDRHPISCPQVYHPLPCAIACRLRGGGGSDLIRSDRAGTPRSPPHAARARAPRQKGSPHRPQARPPASLSKVHQRASADRAIRPASTSARQRGRLRCPGIAQGVGRQHTRGRQIPNPSPNGVTTIPDPPALRPCHPTCRPAGRLDAAPVAPDFRCRRHSAPCRRPRTACQGAAAAKAILRWRSAPCRRPRTACQGAVARPDALRRSLPRRCPEHRHHNPRQPRGFACTHRSRLAARVDLSTCDRT